MGAKRSWWQQIIKYRMGITSSLLVAIIVLITAGYIFNLDWTGLKGSFTSKQTGINVKAKHFIA